jgi:hypothetical protein
MKLVPKSMRVTLNFRRTCRKKIHERIITVSGKSESLNIWLHLFIQYALSTLHIQNGET